MPSANATTSDWLREVRHDLHAHPELAFKEFMLFSPWVIAIPGAALSLLVLAINLMGDGIRDITASEGRS